MNELIEQLKIVAKIKSILTILMFIHKFNKIHSSI